MGGAHDVGVLMGAASEYEVKGMVGGVGVVGCLGVTWATSNLDGVCVLLLGRAGCAPCCVGGGHLSCVTMLLPAIGALGGYRRFGWFC